MIKTLLIFITMFIAKIGYTVESPLNIAVGEYSPFFSQNLPNNGPLTKLVVDIFTLEGVATNVEFYPWARALHMAKIGVAVSPGWISSEDRKVDLLFSEPFYSVSDAIFFLKSAPISAKTFADLKGKKVGTVLESRYGKDFDDASSSFSIDVAGNPTNNLKKLIGKRVDVIIMNRALASELLKTFPKNEQQLIAAGENDLNTKFWSLAVGKKTKNAEKIVASFNAGLAKLKKNGVLAKVTKELNEIKNESENPRSP